MRSLRFSIAGLMGVVLLVAIAGAGVTHPTGPWPGIIALVTHGVICLATVGAICRSGAERVWWLGFASFGWTYAGRTFFFFSTQTYPTHALLTMLGPLMGIPIPANGNFGTDTTQSQAFFQIGHCLWALLAAVIGGFLATALFGAGSGKPAETAAGAPAPDRTSRLWWAWPSAFILSGLVLITSVAVFCAPLEPGIWAGGTYLLTWWLLGSTALGAVFATGRRREFWLGATVLGVGFLFVTFNRPVYDYHYRTVFVPTVKFLEAVRPRFEILLAGVAGDPDSIAAKDARIRQALERRPAMHISEDTTLAELLEFVRQATKGPDGRAIPIYVDPISLLEAEKTMSSTVWGMDLEGIPLRTCLGIILKQLGLAFTVKDGLLLITSLESEDELYPFPYDDPFQIVGHCLLAVIAAGLGGVAAPLMCDHARRRGQPPGLTNPRSSPHDRRPES